MTKYNSSSMPAIFQNQVEKYADRACVAYKKDGKYVDISWNKMNEMIHDLGSFLISMGIKKGDKIALFSENRYEWWVADMATISIRGVNVAIYATSSLEEALYILGHSESRICFVGDDDQLQKVLTAKKKLPELSAIISFNNPDRKRKGVISLDYALQEGKTSNKKKTFCKRIAEIKPPDVATIVYIAVTTGRPRGVMLSHKNIVSNVNQLLARFEKNVSEEYISLSFLPLSLIMERTGTYYLSITVGGKVAFAESFSSVEQNLLEIRPTVLISVPRLYEKIHSTLLNRVANSSQFNKLIFKCAMIIASKNVPYLCNNKPRKGLFNIIYKIADKLVYSRIKKSIGMDKIKITTSGGGPLSVSDAEFFLGMGFTILEGYGLTETSPATNINMIGRIKPGTVGPPLKDTLIKLSDEGEVLIKGPQVMVGYYKNKKATGEIFTKNGFLKTGDIGEIDDDGYLKITGRIKDIIVTAGGKNISPQNIENSLKSSIFIEQVAVIGDMKKYLTALIIPAFKELNAWAKKNHISFIENNDLIENEKVINLFEREVANNIKQFSRVKQIKKFILLNAEWTRATGELTPTLKVKRKVIEEKYAKEIENMYPRDVNEPL